MPLTGNTFFFEWEVRLMEMLQAGLGEKVISAVSALSMFGEELLLIVVLGLIYWSYDKKMGVRIGLNVLMVNIWFPMIKNVVVRRRPYFDHEGIKLFRPIDSSADINDISAQGFSFPSGHSGNAVSMYGSIAKYHRKGWTLALGIILPLLVGFSRVVVGAHYPTDVLCGWLFGLITICIVSFMADRIESKPVLFGILFLTAIPGCFFCKSTDYYTGFGLMVGFKAAVLFEERFVNFENTRNAAMFALRVLGGLVIFGVLNKVLKMPFDEAFLKSSTQPAMFVRAARYAILAFTDFGLYPMVFRFEKRVSGK
ncbi:MAG: phosphatase PAP2 family protein [Clostridia bacterium]|nr:phosphatase PAP2 family protein [Clostridia bacterium]